MILFLESQIYHHLMRHNFIIIRLPLLNIYFLIIKNYYINDIDANLPELLQLDSLRRF